MKQRTKERESNLKVWTMTATAAVIVLGIFALSRIPKNDELNEIRSEIQTVNKQIDQERDSQIKNSAYKQKFDVVGAEKEAQARFLKVIPNIYTKRKLSNQAKEFDAWKKILPGRAGEKFIRYYGDSMGYLKNKSTMIYFGNLTNVTHTKVTVMDVAISKNKKEITNGWEFDYNLRTQKINSFKEISIEGN